MPPKPSSPRLSTIDPAALAQDIATQALNHLSSLHMQLCGLGARAEYFRCELPDPEQSEIYQAVRRLAAYARGDLGLDAPVQEYLISLVPLYLAVLGQADDPQDETLSTPLGVVIQAALGREALESRRALSVTQLAALGSAAQSGVRAFCANGELAAEDVDGEWRITAREARRWLAGRGIGP